MLHDQHSSIYRNVTYSQNVIDFTNYIDLYDYFVVDVYIMLFQPYNNYLSMSNFETFTLFN